MTNNTETFLYIIATVDEKGKHIAPIKIGVTTNRVVRLNNLQSGNPNKLDYFACYPFSSEEEAYLAEKTLHEHFEEERLSGEWFNVNPHAVVPQLILTNQRLHQFISNENRRNSKSIWSWITTSHVNSHIIEKFVAHYKNGWDLYHKFKTEADAKYSDFPPPEGWFEEVCN